MVDSGLWALKGLYVGQRSVGIERADLRGRLGCEVQLYPYCYVTLHTVANASLLQSPPLYNGYENSAYLVGLL